MTNPASPPRSPGRLSNPELRTKAFQAARRLREHSDGATFDPAAVAWLAELVQTLANRLPTNTRVRSTSRSARRGR